MTLTNGQIVVHPHRGPAHVLGTAFHPPIRPASASLQLRPVYGGSAYLVLLGSDEARQLRRPLSYDEAARVIGVFSAPSDTRPVSWAQRMKERRRLLMSGSPSARAGVARDLLRLENTGELGLAEHMMLRAALEPLVREFCLVFDLTRDEALKLASDSAIGAVTTDSP